MLSIIFNINIIEIKCYSNVASLNKLDFSRINRKEKNKTCSIFWKIDLETR